MSPATEKSIKLLGEYNLINTENPEKAKTFAEVHKDDVMFYAVYETLEQVFSTVSKERGFMVEGVKAALAEDDPKIQKALMEHVKVETEAKVMEKLKKILERKILD